MKKRIIAYLSLLFIFFTIGSLTSMLYITLTTSQLKKVITLHGVEILRQDLIIKIQHVEQDLLTVHTELSSRLDKIVLNVTDLDKAVNRCAGCHHSPLITEKLSNVRKYVDEFKNSLSYYITASANESRIRLLKMESYEIGTKLLDLTQEMALIANQKLQGLTQKAIEDVNHAQQILAVTLFLAFITGLWIAAHLTRKIISPIRELIDVSRKIAAGNLGYTTQYRDTTEFGELATSINDMSLSLKESNEQIVLNLNRLAGLYRVTLPLHSVTNETEICKEVSFGVAELIEVEQCGLLLLNDSSGDFEHKYPAFGFSKDDASAIRIQKDDILKLYYSNNRRPLIVNDISAGNIPEGLAGTSSLNVRNMMLGWVRQKGDLIGIIRLANKKEGLFQEESSRLVGIISNNVSVALENIRLYEDLRAQMTELKSTQEQLVQAAKLAAIGELASNVAHEINNPLTSIMGYAELIKEETDISNIMRDVDIIEKESIRARDIVKELLEFTRKRPLEIKKVDLNSLIHESVSLVNIKVKDVRIKIHEYYGDIPLIMGDPNQLKQVFLNIVNNAIDAVSEKGGGIEIRTSQNRSYVNIDISDSGNGIRPEVLSRIFEPFFTTKREKGTGLGLSITHKIVQSHKGSIDVRSEGGKGTRFTVSLPVNFQIMAST